MVTGMLPLYLRSHSGRPTHDLDFGIIWILQCVSTPRSPLRVVFTFHRYNFSAMRGEDVWMKPN